MLRNYPRRGFLIILTACLFLAGCGSNKIESGAEKEVLQVVDNYLENAAAGNWKEAYQTLSGEALAEARANSGRVRAGEKIIAKSLRTAIVCKDIVEVSADFTKNTGYGADRLAYTFRLQKNGDRWLIYKTTPGEYHHGELKPGQISQAVAENIKTYLELPFSQKRTEDYKHLAGKLLQDSRRSKILPVDSGTKKEQEKLKIRVTSMECLGAADGYFVVLAQCETEKGNKNIFEGLVVDVIDVNGTMKICRIDVANVKKY